MGAHKTLKKLELNNDDDDATFFPSQTLLSYDIILSGGTQRDSRESS